MLDNLAITKNKQMTETLLVLTEQSYILKVYCCLETENVAIFKLPCPCTPRSEMFNSCCAVLKQNFYQVAGTYFKQTFSFEIKERFRKLFTNGFLSSLRTWQFPYVDLCSSQSDHEPETTVISFSTGSYLKAVFLQKSTCNFKTT